MSVGGEFRRLGADLLAALREAGLAAEGSDAASLAELLERAGRDLSGAARDALELLDRLAAAPLADAALRRRFEAAYERLDAVCRIILGQPARAAAAPRGRGPRAC